MLAWQRGVKSLYYCRSLSIQRADNVSDMLARPNDVMSVAPPPTPNDGATKYDECLACQ
jgi:ribonucleoside-diphosphate reductase alpha chain